MALIFLLIFALFSRLCLCMNNFAIEIEKTGLFTISIAGKQWLTSGPVKVMNDGIELSSSAKENELVYIDQDIYKSRDEFGTYTSYVNKWKAAVHVQTTFEFNTYAKVYDAEPMVVFGQKFVNGANKTSKGNTDGVMSAYPSFIVKEVEDQEIGFLAFYGTQISATQIGKWSPEVEIHHGADGGFPLVLFDSMMENALVLSPYNTFMSAGSDFSKENNSDTLLSFGIMSSVNSIPVGYEYETIIVAGNNVTGTMTHFGKIMQKKYKKDSSYRETDYTLNYLGYWTDGGACYFYNTGKFSNYEEVILAVYERANKQSIPFRYVQLDEWWYYLDHDQHDACLNWTARPDVFPNGIKPVIEKTQWPVHAHGKFWSTKNIYAKQNGGKYNFIFDEKNQIALPLDKNFWNDLFKEKKELWGLKVYEQDFLITTFEKMTELQTELNLGRMWLLQMGNAALDLDLCIQYCMSMTRNVLQSVEIPAVTQVRASKDYHPGNEQWAISDSSILAYSLGLAPSKDDFHSSVVQNSECKYPNPEPDTELETYVAALSAGIIGPSDTVDSFNKTLIMATCMIDGRLLKPSRPAMSLDSTFLQRAFGSGGPKGHVHVTYSEVGGYTWYLIIAANITEVYKMYPKELPATSNKNPKAGDFFMVASQNSIGHTVLFNLTNVTQSSPVHFYVCSEKNFQLWLLSPVLGNGTNTVLLGELDKVIKVSVTRFTDIQSVDGFNHAISITGAPEEIVHVSFLSVITQDVYTVNCTIGDYGIAKIVGNVYNTYKC